MTSNGNGQLDDTQTRALTAAVNAQKALTAVETSRVPTLRDKRDAAFARALAAGVPASTLADRTELTAGRVSQMRKRFAAEGVI